jgi:hypothetical protein
MRHLALLTLALCACPRAPAPTVGMDAGLPGLVSNAVLGRPVATAQAQVRHILVGWAELAPAYPGGIDRRAADRSQAEAEALVRTILARARAGDPFPQLMKLFSEDPGSAQTSDLLRVRPDGLMEPQFQALSLRLEKGELGVCKTAYGFHIIQRVE